MVFPSAVTKVSTALSVYCGSVSIESAALKVYVVLVSNVSNSSTALTICCGGSAN